LPEHELPKPVDDSVLIYKCIRVNHTSVFAEGGELSELLRVHPGDVFSGPLGAKSNPKLRRNDTVLVNIEGASGDVGHRRWNIARLLIGFEVEFRGNKLLLAYVQWYTKVRSNEHQPCTRIFSNIWLG
jgi:hypothetical protein